MENILYLDDFINIYNKKLNKIITIKPYKKTLENGKVIDKLKFIKIFNEYKEKNNLNKSFFNESITIIINNNYRNNDKCLLKEIFEELNYKNIKMINELELIKINKRKLIINFNYDYFYLYYIDYYGKTRTICYENNLINKSLIINIIDFFKKKEIIVLGKNSLELINILEKYNYNYYFYEDYSVLFIKLLLKNKTV